jgi:hypothetical protein
MFINFELLIQNKTKTIQIIPHYIERILLQTSKEKVEKIALEICWCN